MNKLFAFLLGVIFLFSACGEEKEVLNFYNWGDYIDEDVIDQFEEETGIKVNVDNFETNEDMYIKLSKGGSDYDLATPSDYMIEKMIKEGMLEEIDTSQLENYSKIDSYFKDLDYDPENKYSVPYLWGTVGIAYNTKEVDDVVDSWDILWNKKYKNNIFMLNSQRDTIGVALKKLGYSMNSRDVNELEEAKEILIAQKPLITAYVGDEMKDAMIAEEAALGVTWSGEAFVMSHENPDINYVIPKEGSNIWFDSFVILKDAKNKENAMKFIDFLSRPEISAKNVEYIGYSSPVPEALNYVDEEIRNSRIVNPNLGELPELEVFKDPQDIIKEYERIWLEITSAE